MNSILRTGIMMAGAGLLLASGAFSVTAQDAGKEAAIKARQDFMQDQQHAVNAINNFAKGTGDRSAAIDAANKLIDLSKQMEVKFAALFPPGTSSADVPKSKAKPELWQHLDELKGVPAKLHDAELKLVDVVKTADPQTVGDTMRATYRDTCNALCHDSYRVPSRPG
jgi:cytochrome c556